MIIYAVTNGHLDDIPVEQVRAFEQGLLQFLRDRRPKLGETIRTTKSLPPEEELAAAIKEYKEIFASERGQTAARVA
jgi:F-type H+-transporting ATPase subunit alpha